MTKIEYHLSMCLFAILYLLIEVRRIHCYQARVISARHYVFLSYVIYYLACGNSDTYAIYESFREITHLSIK